MFIKCFTHKWFFIFLYHQSSSIVISFLTTNIIILSVHLFFYALASSTLIRGRTYSHSSFHGFLITSSQLFFFYIFFIENLFYITDYWTLKLSLNIIFKFQNHVFVWFSIFRITQLIFLKKLPSPWPGFLLSSFEVLLYYKYWKVYWREAL